MKILCINHEYPPVGGGAATVTRELLTRLHKKGYQITLLTEKIPEGTPSSENQEFPVFRVNAGRKSVSRGSYLEFIRFVIKSLLVIRKINKKSHPDITFAFFTIPGGLLAMVMKWLYKVPYIVSIRGGDMPGFVINSKLAFFHFLSAPLIRLICKKAALIHTNSERLRELTQKLIPDIPINVIPNGIAFDTNYTIEKPDNNSLCNEQKDKLLKILFIGRLSKQKNLDTFLQGISKLPYFMKEKITFTVVGDGPEKQKLENFVKEYDLFNLVYFQTWVDRKEVRKIYKAHTFSVVPSLDEGMPNSALESIASGCPVLGSRRGTLLWGEETLLERWVVKNELDAKEWKDRIVYFINNSGVIYEDFYRMYLTVVSRFSWTSLLPQYETMIKRCITSEVPKIN